MSEYLQKIIYLTKAQYDTLVGGGTVGSQTGINDNYLYYTTDENITTSDLGDLIVPVSKGGTGKTSFTVGSVLVGNGTATLTELAATNNNTGNTIVKRDSSGNFSAGTITASLSGNATSSSYPYGFTSRPSSATWGTTTGTYVTSWDVGSSCIAFMKDNPSSGKLSAKIDGRFYIAEGAIPVAGLKSVNDYWGMTDPDGADNAFIRTTSQGIIPYQAGNASNGHGYIGTSSWYFKQAYIQDTYGIFNGTIKATGNQNSAWNDVGIVFTNGSRIGENSSNIMGIYSGGERLLLRPNSSTTNSGQGIEISATSLYPSISTTMSLGDSSHKWTNVYSTTFTGALSGNASSATEFSSAASVTLTGDVTGTASAKKGWSIATTIGNGKVTNAKLANSSITIGGVTASLGGSISLADMGLSSALRFQGITSTTLVDGSTTANVLINSVTLTPIQGDVVLYGDGEYVWTGSTWEELGNSSSFKKIQTAVTDPSAGTTAVTSFIATISQDTEGKITPTKRPLPIATTSVTGIVRLGTNATDAAKGNHTHSYLANTDKGAADRPIYITGNAATQTTYRMAGTNATATSAITYSNDLDTGIWYVGSISGDTKTTLFNQSDGVIIANKYNTSWISEIFQDYRTGQLAVRGKNNGTWQSWRKILDDKNTTIPATVPTLSWDATATVLTINGSDVKIKAMAKPTASDIGAATAAHTHDITLTATGNATVTLAASTTYTLTAGGKSVVFKTPADTTYDGEKGITLSSGKFGHTNAVTAQTTQAVYPIKIDAQGHISAYGTAVTIITTGTAATNAMPGNTVVNKVKQTSTTTAAAYKLLLTTTSSPTSGSNYEAFYSTTLTYNPSTKALVTGGTVDGLTLAPQTTGFKISGGTTSKTLTVGADYTLAAACAKAVLSTTTNFSTSTDLPTAKAVHEYVTAKGYLTSHEKGYGKVTVGIQSTAVTSVTALTAAVTTTAAGANEAIKINSGNKWAVVHAAESATSGSDTITIGHLVPSTAISNGGPTAAQTPGYGSTFNIPVIALDEAGHVTGITTATVKIPASDNTTGKNIIAKTSSTTSAITANQSDPYINFVEGTATTPKSSFQLKAGTAVSIAATSAGVITISSSDNDTKNTAGSSATASKIFLVGATSQSTSAQTFSTTYVFATDGAFSAKTLGVNAATTADKVTLQWNAADSSLDFVFA